MLRHPEDAERVDSRTARPTLGGTHHKLEDDMATEPGHHKEQGYEGSGLGPADHDTEHQDPKSSEDSGRKGDRQESRSDQDDRSSSLPQENLGDS